MKHNLIFIGLIFILFLTSCTSIAEASTPTVGSTIKASGTGTAYADPDLVVIQLGVDTIDQDPDVAVNQNTDKMNTLLNLLEESGIPATDIQTTNYNMWVEEIYDQDNQPSGEKRYHVSNQVNVKLKDISKIGELIGEATSAGASNIFGINFAVAETADLEEAALEMAIENARQKAEWMAEDLGLTVGPIVSVVEGGSFTPPIAYGNDVQGIGGASPVPIAQGQVSLSTQVQVEFELQE